MAAPSSGNLLFIGLMSGTSLDGVDAVLAAFPHNSSHDGLSVVAADYAPFSADLRAEMMALQSAGDNEIHREALLANMVVRCYAQCIGSLLEKAGIAPGDIRAIGVHGQTIRHQPVLGYTRQTNNPALLAELTGIDVIADFRSRDIAAGGQGAPLVPAFHQALFSDRVETRAIVNIGGMSNVSILSAESHQVTGFDTGPGNVLMDAWIATHRNQQYDRNGAWAASGTVNAQCLSALRSEAFFAMPPPKSTGRDLFHSAWLAAKLKPFGNMSAVDVQATLAELTATTIADAISSRADQVNAVYVCGGGAFNAHLLSRLQQALVDRGSHANVATTSALGVPPDRVEALAFAWLACRFHHRQPGNLPLVTGAKGMRILGALYPA